MAIEFTCSNCGARLSIPDEGMGETIQCPNCTARLIISNSGTENRENIVYEGATSFTDISTKKGFNLDDIASKGIKEGLSAVSSGLVCLLIAFILFLLKIPPGFIGLFGIVAPIAGILWIIGHFISFLFRSHGK